MNEIAAPVETGMPPASAASERAAAVVWQWRREPAADAGAQAAAAARKRGAIGGTVGLLVAAALYFWKPQMAAVVASIAVLTTLLALASPLGGFRRLTIALEAFARGVGLAMTWLLMTLAYYLLFLPLGLALRAGRKLRITRRGDAALASYWQPAVAPTAGIDAYRKPF